MKMQHVPYAKTALGLST